MHPATLGRNPTAPAFSNRLLDVIGVDADVGFDLGLGTGLGLLRAGALAEIETAEPLEHAQIAFILGGDNELFLAEGDAEPGPAGTQDGAELGIELIGVDAEILADFLFGGANGGESFDLGLGC
ncbi:MAG: hypothetical protein HKL96_03220 [Phycisphaerales bacterium]|nr:hypothetical protein [Phycisphaerales bacterium]